VIGESLMDIVVAPGESGSDEHAGGSPMNVSVGLARLGRPVELLTRIGSDARGQVIAGYLDRAGVPLVAGSIVDGATSTATAVLDETGSATYEFAIEWSLDFIDTLPPCSLVHTGSIAAFLEPGASRLELLLGAAVQAGGDSPVLTFDPNIRPSIIGSRAESLAVVERLAALATVVKVSDEDALWLFGELSPDAWLDRLLGMGAVLAIVTLGGAGTVLATATDRVAIAGKRVDVADTIGAGDSFMSAVIERLAALMDAGADVATLADGSAFDRATLLDIGEFAVSCAAITVSRPGANPPTMDEVRAP
jgi:fructokinase